MKFVKIPSPNFDNNRKNVKIYNYSLYWNEISESSYKKITIKVAKVSTHYLISKRGVIYQMVKDQHVCLACRKIKMGE